MKEIPMRRLCFSFWRRSVGSTSIPARKVSRIPPNPAMKSTQGVLCMWKTLAAITPMIISTIAVDMASSTEIRAGDKNHHHQECCGVGGTHYYQIPFSSYHKKTPAISQIMAGVISVSAVSADIISKTILPWGTPIPIHGVYYSKDRMIK